MSSMMADAMLKWMDENCDEIIFLRDVTNGLRITVYFCYASTGCPGSIQHSGSLYYAIARAMEEQAR